MDIKEKIQEWNDTATEAEKNTNNVFSIVNIEDSGQCEVYLNGAHITLATMIAYSMGQHTEVYNIISDAISIYNDCIVEAQAKNKLLKIKVNSKNIR